jgi:hypothetical protein
MEFVKPVARQIEDEEEVDISAIIIRISYSSYER